MPELLELRNAAKAILSAPAERNALLENIRSQVILEKTKNSESFYNFDNQKSTLDREVAPMTRFICPTRVVMNCSARFLTLPI
ncbi:hypothetical protein CYMTET_50870 [Cymbomonas tetramitiformis]|uniref:Uncharacterized protein n=1 Tax=Cymbomonas tetramitiformis TaxID=36881 RepID=A0AAE0EUB6_9CHLO|nr:hypothetical protein CYMTET_50870 [Cymbomonas tetramitiformis]